MAQNNGQGAASLKELDRFKGLMGKAYTLMDRLDERAIALAVYERVREKAIYRITFKGRKGMVEITGFSVDGAEELYRLCRCRGIVPLLEVKEIQDNRINGHFMTTIIWRVIEPTVPPVSWEMITRGSASVTEDLHERKSLGKAQRNAQLKVIPLVIRDAMKAVLGQRLGVKDLVWDEENDAPVETKKNETVPPVKTGPVETREEKPAAPSPIAPPEPASTNATPVPSPDTATPPAGRSLTKVIRINGGRVRTAGIEGEQLEALQEAAARFGKEKVIGLIQAFGVDKSVYLTREEAVQVLAKLNEIASAEPGGDNGREP